jgi:hypothetical protein
LGIFKSIILLSSGSYQGLIIRFSHKVLVIAFNKIGILCLYSFFQSQF